jgi:hypothetical protein
VDPREPLGGHPASWCLDGHRHASRSGYVRTHTLLLACTRTQRGKRPRTARGCNDVHSLVPVLVAAGASAWVAAACGGAAAVLTGAQQVLQVGQDSLRLGAARVAVDRATGPERLYEDCPINRLGVVEAVVRGCIRWQGGLSHVQCGVVGMHTRELYRNCGPTSRSLAKPSRSYATKRSWPATRVLSTRGSRWRWSSTSSPGTCLTSTRQSRYGSWTCAGKCLRAAHASEARERTQSRHSTLRMGPATACNTSIGLIEC